MWPCNSLVDLINWLGEPQVFSKTTQSVGDQLLSFSVGDPAQCHLFILSSRNSNLFQSVSYRRISQILVSLNRTDGLLPTGVFSGITKFLVKMSRVEVYLPSLTHTRMRDNGKTCPRVRLPSVLPNQPTRVARAVVPLQPRAPPPGPPQRRRQQRVRRLHPARAGPRPPRAAPRPGLVL